MFARKLLCIVPALIALPPQAQDLQVAEPFFPGAVAHDHDQGCTGLVVFLEEAPAESGLGAQDPKSIPGEERRIESYCLLGAPESHGARVIGLKIGEGTLSFPPFDKIVERREKLYSAEIPALHPDQSLRILERDSSIEG